MSDSLGLLAVEELLELNKHNIIPGLESSLILGAVGIRLNFNVCSFLLVNLDL